MTNSSDIEIISTDRITYRFSNGYTALKEVSISLWKGEFLIIAGRNGSGKSVLARHWNGLYAPTEGEIYYRGKPVRKQLNTVRRRVGMVFQNPEAQFVGHTVEEDIAFGPENLAKKAMAVKKLVESALETTGLQKKRHYRPDMLSGGEKRRLAIAGILAMDPEVIILDEPFSNLDFPGVQSVLEQIVHLHSEGHTIVVITHNIEAVAAHADRIAVMSEGQIAEIGSPSKMICNLKKYGVRPPFDSSRPVESMTWLS